MMQRALLLVVLGLAACGSPGPQAARGFDDPAVQRLYALPVPVFFAERQLAGEIAAGCARYRFDAVLSADLVARRSAEGQGRIAAVQQRDAIDTMTGIRTRELRARYGNVPGEGDMCPLADAETARGSALSALLERVEPEG